MLKDNVLEKTIDETIPKKITNSNVKKKQDPKLSIPLNTMICLTMEHRKMFLLFLLSQVLCGILIEFSYQSVNYFRENHDFT